MRLFLFSGFLGSGKTTLILSLAQRLTEQGKSSALIVNEVGEVGIDGRVLGDAGQEVYEITAGCICCQIGVDLVRTLEEVTARYRPEVVIVEASGVATPAGVLESLEYFRGASLETTVVTLLDPTRLDALIDVMEPLIESQVSQADILVVTKMDEAGEEELTFARETARRLAPALPVCELSSEDEAAVAACLDLVAGEPQPGSVPGGPGRDS